MAENDVMRGQPPSAAGCARAGRLRTAANHSALCCHGNSQIGCSPSLLPRAPAPRHRARTHVPAPPRLLLLVFAHTTQRLARPAAPLQPCKAASLPSARAWPTRRTLRCSTPRAGSTWSPWRQTCGACAVGCADPRFGQATRQAGRAHERVRTRAPCILVVPRVWRPCRAGVCIVGLVFCYMAVRNVVVSALCEGARPLPACWRPDVQPCVVHCHVASLGHGLSCPCCLPPAH